MEPRLTHLDEEGRAVMVDVSDKAPTARTAVAQGEIRLSPAALDAVLSGSAPKGDVLAAARIAGIMAAKRTAELIPLCHPLPLCHVSLDLQVLEDRRLIRAVCTARITGQTGVEMEALTGVSVALLTIYDMCKALDKGMEIRDIRLVRKEGGKSGTYAPTGRVLAISGVKNAGKTTLITALLPHLWQAGLSVAVIKHDGHTFQADPPDTDTGRFMTAGAVGAALFDSGKYKTIHCRRTDEHDLLSRFPEADLILLEGFKHTAWPKLEVVRGGVSDGPVCQGTSLLGVVTDLPLALSVPVFPLNDPAAVAAFLLGRLGRRQRDDRLL